MKARRIHMLHFAQNALGKRFLLRCLRPDKISRKLFSFQALIFKQKAEKSSVFLSGAYVPTKRREERLLLRTLIFGRTSQGSSAERFSVANV